MFDTVVVAAERGVIRNVVGCTALASCLSISLGKTWRMTLSIDRKCRLIENKLIQFSVVADQGDFHLVVVVCDDFRLMSRTESENKMALNQRKVITTELYILDTIYGGFVL